MGTAAQVHNGATDCMETPELITALNELGRTINLVTTYGKNHPAAISATAIAIKAFEDLFATRKKIVIGAFNGFMTLDNLPITISGTLQKSLERRLIRLRITGLRIARGITQEELLQLTAMLAATDAETFQRDFSNSGLKHIQPDNTQLQIVGEGQVVAKTSDLANGLDQANGLHILDEYNDNDTRPPEKNLHIEQIVAFLKGDVDVNEGSVGEELTRLANDPEKLGRMILESVAVRQSVSQLEGESLSDIILGCLRRTYDGLRQQPAFKSAEGKADLKKALLMLEKNVLEKMRSLAGEENPEMDRKIVQSIREMDERLSFEIVAAQYVENNEAIGRNKAELHRFIQTHGTDVAEKLLDGTDFPSSDWRRIVVESSLKSGTPPSSLTDGLNTLTTVFEKLEKLMRSEATDGTQVKHLLGKATQNLDGTLDSAREKLTVLSQHIKDGETLTIGGQAHRMTRSELLASLSEVAQELMQPLTAINTSLEMMLHGYVGTVSEEQQDLLKLASNSGEHLKFLMNMLIDIVGCPANKGVDSRFHTTSEQVVLMKDAEGQEHLPLSYS